MFIANALAIVLARLLRVPQLLVKPSQRTVRANLQRLIVSKLERTFEERLRLPHNC